jgi:hypothetical protein
MTVKTSGSSGAASAKSASTKAVKGNATTKTGRAAAGAVRARATKAAPGHAAAAKKVSAAKAKPKAEADKSVDKPKKLKLVRDSFTMPGAEYAEIAAIKKRFLMRGVAVKKSEVLRAAVLTLSALKDAALMKAVEQLAPIKAGRPLKEKK